MAPSAGLASLTDNARRLTVTIRGANAEDRYRERPGHAATRAKNREDAEFLPDRAMASG